MRIRTSWLLIFLEVPFNKIPLFWKDQVIFMISFISLFVSVIPIPLKNEVPVLYIFTKCINSHINKKIWDVLWLRSVIFFVSFIACSAEVTSISNKLLEFDKYTSTYTIFDNFILTDKPLPKALQNLGTCLSVNNNKCENLDSLLEFSIKFHERFRVISLPDFILILIY